MSAKADQMGPKKKADSTESLPGLRFPMPVMERLSLIQGSSTHTQTHTDTHRHTHTQTESWRHQLSPYIQACTCLCACVLRCSVISDSATPSTIPREASVQGTSQARLLEQVAISYSKGSSQPGDWTHVSCTRSRFFANEPPRKPVYPGTPQAKLQPDFSFRACVCSPAQSCPTLHGPTDCSPPGSSVHGILQARMLEISFLFMVLKVRFSDHLEQRCINWYKV